MQYKTVAYTFSALLLSSTTLAATPAPSPSTPSPAPSPNVICNVDYSRNAAAQDIAEQCCNSAGGVPVNFREAKIQGCNNFLLRSPRNLMFVGCIQDKLHEEPACYNAEPVPTPSPTASPTPNVICTVDYSKNPEDQGTIEQCCNSNGGVPVDFREAKLEGCNNFLLRSPENLGFVGCIQQKLHKTPACYNAAPVPVSSSTSIFSTHPHPSVVTNSFTHPNPHTMSISSTHPNPVTTTSPTTIAVYCDVRYGTDASKQHYVASCCSQAGATSENLISSKIERCDNLILRGSIFDKYVSCLYKANLNPACYPSSATSTATSSTHFSTHPHPSVVSSPTATASVAPVATKAICTVNYSRRPANRGIVAGCCKAARGTSVNFVEAKLEGCENLRLGSKALNNFGKCVKAQTKTEVDCQTQ